MLKAKAVTAAIIAVLFIVNVGIAQSLEEYWDDFLYYTKVAQDDYDLAKANAQLIIDSNPDPVELLELSQKNPTGYRLVLAVVEMAEDAELVELTSKILAIIEEGRYIKRANPQIIVEEIRRLSTTARGKLTATERLKDAAEYAIPYMLEALADPSRQKEYDNIIETIPKIGKSAIRPLTAALQTNNSMVKSEIIKALGRIGYPQSLPYLKYIIENDSSAEIRTVANNSIRQIDPRAISTNSAVLFYQLAENYYYHSESLAAPKDVDFANVWYWDSENSKITREEVSHDYFNELMAMRSCEWALRAEENYGNAIGLWIASFFKAEATGHNMPEYFGDDHAKASEYATIAGPEYLHQALARAIKDANADVALGAVEALASTAGEASLLSLYGSTQPVLMALSFNDKAVKYSSAIAVANAGPRRNFNEAGIVVTNLAQALAEGISDSSQTDENWSRESANEYALRSVQAMLKVAQGRNPVINLSPAQNVLISATKNGNDQIKVLAGQVLAHLQSSEAQKAIAEMALDAYNEPDTRKEAFASLAISAKLYTSLLPEDILDKIYSLIQTNPDLRSEAMAAFGALNLPSRKVKDLILDQATD